MYRNTPAASPLVLLILGNMVEACDRRTGAVVWRYQAAHENEAYRLPIRCVVEQDRAIVVAAGTVSGFWSADASPVVACMDYLSGRMLWRIALPTQANVGYTHAAILVDEGQIIVAAMRAMFAISLGDGSMLWQRWTHGAADLRAGLAIPGKDVQVDSK
jgi:glucose dehydrogenase